MIKPKDYFSKFKYEACIFITLCMNFLLFFTKEEIMSDALYPIHLVDIKAGFISRTLVGTINGLLFSKPTIVQTAVVHTAITIITFLLTAIFIGGCIRAAEKESGKQLFLLSLVFAVAPYGFMTFINLFELLDIYWVLAAALCLLAADGKKAAFLIPLFIVIGGWAHYSFVLAFMPVIYVVFFNKLIKEKGKRTYILTALMVTVSVASTIYFFSTSRTFNVISFDEFTQYILDKAGDKITEFEVYCGEAFRPYDEIPYDYYIEKYNLPEWTRDASDLKRALYGYFAFAFIDGSFAGLISDVLLALPAVAFFGIIWHKAMKTAETKADRFMYFLCMISPLIQVVALFTSSDTSRWLSLMMISDLFMLAYFIKEKSAPVTASLGFCFDIMKKHKAALLFLALFYLSIVFVW